MSSWFATFMGIPMHPLVDHFAVVLFPLGLLGLLGLLVSHRLRARYGWLTMAVLTVGTVFLLVAKESGEQLAHMVGLPARHAHYADLLVLAALPTWLLATVWFLLRRNRDRTLNDRIEASQGVGDGAHAADPADRPARRSLATTGLGLLTGLGAVASLVLVTLVGHTGAEATWAGTTNTTSSATTSSATGTATSSNPSATGSASASTSGSASSSTTYTMTQVAAHASSSSCWSVINGTVYNLTSWISQHPGGSDKILAICGKDGSSAFNAQHGSDTRPQQILATYKIGTLG